MDVRNQRERCCSEPIDGIIWDIPMTFTHSLMDPHSILRSRIPLTELTWLADGQPERNLQIKCIIIASQYISEQQQKQQTCLKQHIKYKKSITTRKNLTIKHLFEVMQRNEGTADNNYIKNIPYRTCRQLQLFA